MALIVANDLKKNACRLARMSGTSRTMRAVITEYNTVLFIILRAIFLLFTCNADVFHGRV